MKILIAGFGSIGRRHFRNLLALGERDIILYRTGKSTLPDDELADFPVETDLQRALAHRPQAVIVANPTSLHLDVAIPAASNGCHIFLEKPISHSLERIDGFQAAQRAGGGQVFVGFQFRFHPGLQQFYELLQEERIGRTLSVRAHWGEYLPGWHPWEDYRRSYSARTDLGGGVILTLCHPLDYLRWLIGEVNAVWAFAGNLSDLALEVEDTTEIGLRFDNRVIGSLHLDYNQRPATHHVEVIGTQGTLRWDNANGQLQLYQAQNRGEGWQTLPLRTDSENKNEFERNDLFLNEMRHFLKVASGEAEPLITLEDGIQALRLALAAHQSAQQGKLISL
jgi:predicted dehydrogenase